MVSSTPPHATCKTDLSKVLWDECFQNNLDVAVVLFLLMPSLSAVLVVVSELSRSRKLLPSILRVWNGRTKDAELECNKASSSSRKKPDKRLLYYICWHSVRFLFVCLQKDPVFRLHTICKNGWQQRKKKKMCVRPCIFVQGRSNEAIPSNALAMAFLGPTKDKRRTMAVAMMREGFRRTGTSKKC